MDRFSNDYHADLEDMLCPECGEEWEVPGMVDNGGFTADDEDFGYECPACGLDCSDTDV